MQIKQEYIDRSEELLLPEGCHFDDERVSLIRRIESGDLHDSLPFVCQRLASIAKLFTRRKTPRINQNAVTSTL